MIYNISTVNQKFPKRHLYKFPPKMSFAGSLKENTEKLKKIRQIKENPLSALVSNYDEGQKVFDFYLDESCVRPKNIIELRANLKYIKLKDISSKLNITKSWFTIGVICEITKKEQDFVYTLSDLKTCRYKARLKFPTSYRKWDIILIANCFILSAEQCILVEDPKFVKRIGRNDHISKCYRADPKNKQCSVYIDVRNGTNCTYHCEQSFKEAGMGRAILKQTFVPLSNTLPDSMVQNDDDLKKTTIDDKKLVKAYIEAHPYSRAAKLKQAQKSDKPEIGKGFKEGDMIDLDF